MFGWITDLFRRAPKMRPPAEQLAHLEARAADMLECEIPLQDPDYWNWKISCSSGLFYPETVTPEIERRAIQSLVDGAANLARNPNAADFPYFRAAVLLPVGDLFASEVTAFFNRGYYLNFWGGEPQLPAERLTGRFDLAIPDGFEIRGILIRQEMDEEEADWPGVYKDGDGRYWHEAEQWTIGQAP